MHDSPIESTVRTTLARYLDLRPDELHPSDLLLEELELTTLDVVLVVLHVEELEGEEYDLYTLESVRTVGELIRFFRRQHRAARRLSA
jgi:acyl carrier protein